MKKAMNVGKAKSVKAPVAPKPSKYGTETAPKAKSTGYTGIKAGASKVAGNTTPKPKFNAAAFSRARAKHFNLPQPGSDPHVNLKVMPKAKGEKQTAARAEDLGRK